MPGIHGRDRGRHADDSGYPCFGIHDPGLDCLAVVCLQAEEAYWRSIRNILCYLSGVLIITPLS
ncbi:hypothetical protein PSEUDO8Z_100247 [Pseudomonas sp. 8Z]|nr:hypothetical protein PSEUDO8Z_100247 [Pseudomonas sp. 8Z]